MSLRNQLQEVYDRHGELTPELVVDTARPPDHPLHERFEWDDRVAAELHRRTQASELIRSVRVVYREATDTDPERTVRKWHASRTDQGERSYEPVERIAEDPFRRRLLLADMERDWRALRRRYEAFDEFWRLVADDVQEVAS